MPAIASLLVWKRMMITRVEIFRLNFIEGAGKFRLWCHDTYLHEVFSAALRAAVSRTGPLLAVLRALGVPRARPPLAASGHGTPPALTRSPIGPNSWTSAFELE